MHVLLVREQPSPGPLLDSHDFFPQSPFVWVAALPALYSVSAAMAAGQTGA